MGSTFNRLDNFKHIKMKLIAISALAGFAAAEQMLNAMNAQSDECAGCEVAPAPVFTCFGESCSDVECGNMAAIADEEGNPTASVECAGCGGFHEALAEGAGFAGGCCEHPAMVLNFSNCDGGCERLSKYHCDKSETCDWNAECNCCQAK